MDRFQTLFGVARKVIKRHCIITPFLAPGILNHLGIKKLNKGLLYSVGTTDNFSFIKTHMGAAFVGDAILQLKETDCEHILFLGSCGLINKDRGFDIGSLVLPTLAYPVESFCDLVAGRNPSIYPAYPHKELLEQFKKRAPNLPNASCVSFASLELEESYLPLFRRLGTDVIEMECAALFNAAQQINRQAVAILFISDILGEKLFWQPSSLRNKKRLAEGISHACRVIIQFTANH